MSGRKTSKNKSKTLYSKIEHHKMEGKMLIPPMMQVSNVHFMSWADRCIPNILWACLLVAHLPRDKCLNLFSSVVINTREKIDNYEDSFVTHNHISNYTEEQFATMFSKILVDEESKYILSALLLIDSLPDKNLWSKWLNKPDPEKHFEILAKSVATCFAHQSQEATDIRWLKVMHFAYIGKLQFPTTMNELIDELRFYPNMGDMNKVRPFIRSAEMSVRFWEFGEWPTPRVTKFKLPPEHGEQFWQEMLNSTACNPHITPNSASENKEIKNELIKLYSSLQEHFFLTLQNTSVNPKHDAAFGMVLYAISLVITITLSVYSTTAVGRSILRTLAEMYITFSFLVKKDDPTIWKQYRNYGSGKVKLAFLKNVNTDELPDFLDISRLEQLANEDLWLEFQDISLGSWTKSDLRKMAIEAEIKDFYDRHYDWLSGYVHGHWGAIRDSVYCICFNPLHRFHRIPAPPNFSMPSVLPDCCKIINLMLDKINQLYPPYKKRLCLYKTT